MTGATITGVAGQDGRHLSQLLLLEMVPHRRTNGDPDDARARTHPSIDLV
jgi:hypothetical protein